MTTPRRLLRLLALVVLVGLGASALPPGVPGATRTAAAQDALAQAKQRYAAGKAFYDARRYQEAILEFRAADQLAPSGINDFNIALCYEALGDAAAAVAHYRTYLQRVPDAGNRAEIEAAIARMQPAGTPGTASGGGAGEPSPPVTEPSPPVVDARPPAPPPARTGDPELDRVAAIDVGAIRDQRGVRAAAAGAPTAPAGSGGDAPAPPKAAADTPLYKKWWFWVVAGIGAYVVLSILADSSSSTPQPGPARTARPDDGSLPAAAGLPLWRF